MSAHCIGSGHSTCQWHVLDFWGSATKPRALNFNDKEWFLIGSYFTHEATVFKEGIEEFDDKEVKRFYPHANYLQDTEYTLGIMFKTVTAYK